MQLNMNKLSMDFFNKINPKILSGVCVGLFFFGIFFGYLIFPSTLNMLIAKNIGLKPGSEIREMYTKVPFPIDFKIYIFNITNKDEVFKGEKVKLQEIGPYMFEEWKEKFDMVDNDKEDTLVFNMKNTFIFRPDLSNGLTGNEIITTIHPLIAGMSLAVNIDKKPMLPLVQKAINELFHDPEQPFYTGSVMDLLFDGVPIDCSSTEFEAIAVCSQFADGEVKAIVPAGEKKYKFSLFGAANNTPIGIYKVFRGIKNYRDVGRVISFNDETEMNVWDGDECNTYKGTDSTIFPPLAKKEDGIWAYEPSICLSLGAYYVEPSSYKGIPTLRYLMDLGDTRNDPKMSCYCMSPDDCPPVGTLNLFPCVGSPLVISMPHFYKADPALLRKIGSGLNPNQKEHEIFLDFEIMSGSPVSAAKRLQFGLDVVPIPEIKQMANMPEMVLPLFWVEESAALNQTYVDMVLKLFTAISVVNSIKWTFISIGIIGGSIAAYAYYLKQNNVVPVTVKKETVVVEDVEQKIESSDDLNGKIREMLRK